MDIIEQQLEGMAESTKSLLVSGARSNAEAESIIRRIDYAKYKAEEAKAVIEGNFIKADILHAAAENAQRRI